ncbi:MAG: hypothetical protein IIA54_00520 [Chloroflexi bacterium]|nr:hypothetical protein [Chloroflexota bacterium]
MAVLVFAVLGMAVYLFRGVQVAPTDTERELLASALKAVAYRRLNVLGAADDLLQLGWALTTYAGRAIRTTKTKKEKPRQVAAESEPEVDAVERAEAVT